MSYPGLVQIETTAECNAQCIFCSHKSIKRKLGEMPWKLFVKVIDQCKELNIKRICPFLNGEPFLDSLIFKRLEHINKVLPEVELHIFSNMGLLDAKKLQKLSKIRNIRTFFMSLTSYDSESCKKYMGLDFDKVYSNVLGLLKLNKEKRFIQCIRGSGIDSGSGKNSKFVACWSGVGITDYFISARENWLGAIRSSKQSNQNSVCPRAYHLCIYYDGTVPLCCFDNDGEKTFGNVNDKTLLEIYNSEKYRQYRILKKKNLKPCNRCTV